MFCLFQWAPALVLKSLVPYWCCWYKLTSSYYEEIAKAVVTSLGPGGVIVIVDANDEYPFSDANVPISEKDCSLGSTHSSSFNNVSFVPDLTPLSRAW